MPHSFKLNIEKEKSRLALLEGEREVSAREWPESRDMGRQLFEAIDGILVEAGLESSDVPRFEVVTDISDSFTSVKIGQSVANAWEYAVASGAGNTEKKAL